jgi:hypothetical protein
MIRPPSVLFVIGLLSLGTLRAQEADTGGSTITPGTSTTAPSFGGLATPGPEAAPTGATGGPAAGVSSGGAAAAAAGAAPINIPGAYGALSTTVTPGEGRFAQPPFQIGISISQGYDDNIFSTPHELPPVQEAVPAPTPVPVQVVPTPPPIPIPIRPLPTPTPAVIEFPTPIPTPTPTGPQKRIGSAVTNTRLTAQVQVANPRTVFTLDAALAAIYYWNRPGKAQDYNGSLAFLFYHKLNPRMNVTATADIAYASQPDFSRVNAPTAGGSGNYISAVSKLDLSYQWSARLSTVTSYSLNATIFENVGTQGSDIYSNILGTQFRFLLSPRTTATIDVRTEASFHPSRAELDSSSNFLLVGFDTAFSRRLRATARIGEEIRSPSSGSGAALSSPVLEATASYIYGHQSTLTWTNSFGLDESNSVGSQKVSYRTSVGINHVLTARMIGSVGLNYNRGTTTDLSGQVVTPAIENQFSLGLGLQYVVSRHLSLNANFTRSQIFSSVPFTDYDRNQFTLGGAYTF